MYLTRKARKGLGENISMGTIILLVVFVLTAAIVLGFVVPTLRNKIATKLTVWAGQVGP